LFLTNNSKKPIYKKWWFWTILSIAVITSFAVIFIINESYKHGGYITLWDAQDALSFYGSYLSFIGSLIIGIIAVFMSKKANNLTEKIIDLEVKDRKAFVTVNLEYGLKFYCYNDEGSMLNILNNSKITLSADYIENTLHSNDIVLLQLSLTNISNNYITGVHLNKFKISPEYDDKEALAINCDSDNSNLIAPNESKEALIIVTGLSTYLNRSAIEYVEDLFDISFELDVYNLVKEKTTLEIEIFAEKPRKYKNKEDILYKINYSLSLNEFKEI